MVAGDHHGRDPEGGEPVQGVVEELDSGERRHGTVVDVARDQHRIDVPLAHRLDEMIEEGALCGEQAHAVEGPPQMPVGSVQKPHVAAPTSMFFPSVDYASARPACASTTTPPVTDLILAPAVGAGGPMVRGGRQRHAAPMRP